MMPDSQHDLLPSSDWPLMVDLYELAMAQAYWKAGLDGVAVFSLFYRQQPPHRNYMLACGQQSVCRIIQELQFTADQLQRLQRLDMFQPEFLEWLANFRFTGNINCLPEGTPVFAQEPFLEVEAPVIEAQLLESLVMNYVHLETLLASKAARIVTAAGDRPVIDFGMRRMHGLDAAYRGVRAYKIAGLAGTSHVLAGQDFDLPVRGTMAHSFIQAHDDELAAFRTYARLYPGTTLLVDTYDTRRAVDRIIRWLSADPDAHISGIRLDSGDMVEQARHCRQRLDDAGFEHIRILASGGLDEYAIQAMVKAGAPIDGFGVGTALGSSSDSPTLDLAYKLTEYTGLPRMKNSPGKQSFPGAKQVYRQTNGLGHFSGDVITGRNERCDGEPLLVPTLRAGQLVAGAIASLEGSRRYCQDMIRKLPKALLSLDDSVHYPVTISRHLKSVQQLTIAELQGKERSDP